MLHSAIALSKKPLSVKTLILSVAIAGIVFAACLFGVHFNSVAPQIGLWPANAILLGLLAVNRRASNPVSWILSGTAYLVVGIYGGHNLGDAALLALPNLAGVAVGLLLLSRYARILSPITNPAGLVTLFGIISAVAITNGVIGAPLDRPNLDSALLGQFFVRGATEFVNLAIFLPLLIGRRMIKGPPPQKLSLRRDKLVLHGAALASLLLACFLMVAIGGPGSIVFYLPPLIWCATRVRAVVAFGLSSAAAIWTLIAVPSGIVLLDAGHVAMATSWDLASFRLGVGSTTIGAVAVVALNAFWRRTHHEQVQRANQDSLTGLLDRKQFYHSADYALNQLERGTTSIAFAVNVDRFRSINVEYGRPAGDQVLQTVADLLTANIRKGDILGHLGGEEFAILLPGAGIEEGNRVAERMRASIAAEPFSHDGSDFSTSVSIGLVEFRTPANFSRMLSVADEALYEAKNAGRNRVVAYRNGAEESAA